MPPSPLCPGQDEVKRASRQRGLLACVAKGDRLSWISVSFHFFSFLFSVGRSVRKGKRKKETPCVSSAKKHYWRSECEPEPE